MVLSHAVAGVLLFLAYFSGPRALAGPKRLTFSAFKDSGLTIVSSRILAAVYKDLGYTVRIEELPAARALVMANDGTMDGELVRLKVVEEEFRNLIRVPVPMWESRIVIFTLNPQMKVTGWESLRGYRIGTLIGYKYMEKKLNADKIPYRSFSTFTELLRSVQQPRGREAGILDETDLLVTLNRTGIKRPRILDHTLLRYKLWHFLHKKNKPLVARVTATLKKMHKDGRIKKIRSAVMNEIRSGGLKSR